MFGRVLSIFLVLLVGLVPHSTAMSDVAGLLRDRDFDALEAHFGSIEAKFEGGELSEFDLLDAYKPFYSRDDVYSSEMLAWTEAHPDSYAAHVARGTYYRKLGEFKRGTTFSAAVPESTAQAVVRALALAEGELTSALALSSRPHMAVLGLLNIARYRNDEAAADHYLSEARRILPGNILARARYLDHLRPRWGGSYEQMSAFVQRCRSEGLAEDQLVVLAAMIENDKGLVAQTRGDLPAAAQHFRASLLAIESAHPQLRSTYFWHSLQACNSGLVTGPPCSR